MTNGVGIPILPCCPESSGNDLHSLPVVLGVICAAYAATQWMRARKGKTKMKWKNGAIVAALLLALAAVFALKSKQPAPAEPPPPAGSIASVAEAAASLPRLVDLGADKCIPCKMMAPILEDLKTAYDGKMQVEFIDVWKNPDAGDPYGVRVIPTQIFYDAEGKELFRHEGFYAKEDILAKWKELGFEFP